MPMIVAFATANLLALPAVLAFKPVIGVFPTVPEEYERFYAVAYEKWLEQSGASTLLLPSSGDVEEYFYKINALLLTGGPTAAVTPFARGLVERALKAHHAGDYFPVWGTCLGFQWLIEIIGGRKAVTRDTMNATDYAERIELTSASPGRLFRSANASILKWLTTDNVTYENHRDGAAPTPFEKNKHLLSTFDILATSFDKNNKSYVAALEGKSSPIYGVQWHPEKIRYVKYPHSHIPRTPEAAAVADYLSKFFVDEARKNKHRVLSDEVVV